VALSEYFLFCVVSKIIKYVDYLITSVGQHVHLRSHKAQVTHVPILFTVSTKYPLTFLSVIRHEQSTRRTTFFTLKKGFSLCHTLLMVDETRQTSKISVKYVAGAANVGEHVRRFRHTVATYLVADVSYITPTTFMACITYVLYSHCTSEVSYHVIMSFDIAEE